MIRYALKCSEGHEFDGWFRDSSAFEAQAAAGQVACAACGSNAVEKALMAPAVPARDKPAALAPASAREKALAALRRKIETDSEYVGREFAAEARRIHEGGSDRRAIWGEASREEASSLHEDGIPAVPIPWMTRRND